MKKSLSAPTQAALYCVCAFAAACIPTRPTLPLLPSCALISMLIPLLFQPSPSYTPRNRCCYKKTRIRETNFYVTSGWLRVSSKTSFTVRYVLRTRLSTTSSWISADMPFAESARVEMFWSKSINAPSQGVLSAMRCTRNQTSRPFLTTKKWKDVNVNKNKRRRGRCTWGISST